MTDMRNPELRDATEMDGFPKPPMTDNEKIAKALGWPETDEDHHWIDVDKIPKEWTDYIEREWGLDGMYAAGYTDDDSYYDGWHIDKSDVARLIKDRDPLFERIVRDQVRELCETVCYNHACGKHEVTVFKRNIRNHLVVSRSGDKPTEAAAYRAALIWLDERGK